MAYTIKQFAEKIDMTAYTLRYYEKEGLLPFIERNANGIRLFDDKDIEWIKVICCLRDTGMSIAEIKRYVELCMGGKETIEARRRIIAEHKEQVEKSIERMQGNLAKINDKLKYYDELAIAEGIDICNPIDRTDALKKGKNVYACDSKKKLISAGETDGLC
jgi:DNA-binding transcriptional MerR regulator